MPPRIDDETRAKILKAIKAGKLSRNAIARKYGVSVGTVTNIAKAANLTSAFDRSKSKTARATQARKFDALAARAKLLVDLYGDAQRFRERAWSPYTQIVTGPLGTELVTTKLPPIRDQQAAYTAMAIALDKALKIESVNTGDGAEQGKTMIGDLRAALGLAYDAIEAQEAQAVQDAGYEAPPAE
ncbi:helix-turn-helix domain-containing protein [Actinomadura violacea]|uniref:Helix-turn-helix domain-containing protein n=1 Tax=Actinomadura violacea TaxID=2819934 RepID=A0ABS3RWM7_9ACTN|nr:helix-turn-helix domain-containing protein [Actinomadura violacea]MBO2461167.1 helix-turn-helix domain-containing protein [Actinomadura violacea]